MAPEMDLFWGIAWLEALLVLLPIFLPIYFISFTTRWLYRGRTNQTFREVAMWALLTSVGFSLPIASVLASWVAWWLTGFTPD
jgi:heme/copper-type cytochrome/quinol oxidase subunit 2